MSSQEHRETPLMSPRLVQAVVVTCIERLLFVSNYDTSGPGEVKSCMWCVRRFPSHTGTSVIDILLRVLSAAV